MQQVPQPLYVGKVIISNREPAKHNEFYVWIDKDVDIDVGSTFVVTEDGRNKIIGLVVDSESRSTSADAIDEYFSSNVGDPMADPLIDRRVIHIYKVRVMRRDPSITKPPTSRMKVRIADKRDIEFLNSMIEPKNRVVAGFIYGSPSYELSSREDPNNWIPLYYNAEYLAGPEGAHVMITGKSGLAAKTSYALFLIFSFLNWARANNKRVAVIAFNVKHCDLFKLVKLLDLQTWDDVENLLRQRFTNRPDIASDYIGLWKRLRQEFGLSSPTDLIPKDVNGNPMLYYWTYDKSGTKDVCIRNYLQQNPNVPVAEYKYGIADLTIEELIEVLSGGDYKSLTSAQQEYVELLASVIMDCIVNQNSRLTINDIYNEALRVLTGTPNTKLHTLAFCGSSRLARDVASQSTVRSVARGIVNFINKNQSYGLELSNPTGNPIKGSNIREGINIIQLNSLSEAMQRLIFNSVLRQLEQIQQSPARFDHVLIFVDELNKFAPKNYDSPIKRSIIEIAARARNLNIGLIGAQQFASFIDTEVYGNAATYIIGNTDDAELKNDEYDKFGDLKSLIPGLSQGEVIIYQLSSHYSPIKVRFPLMLHHLFR